jgi:hypothetical protein
MNRYGVRAFSTLEGYADRNRETESASSGLDARNDRPPSRFSSEKGTKADAKQSLEGSLRPDGSMPSERKRCPKVCARLMDASSRVRS